MSEEDQIQAAIKASLEQDQTFQSNGADEEKKEWQIIVKYNQIILVIESIVFNSTLSSRHYFNSLSYWLATLILPLLEVPYATKSKLTSLLNGYILPLQVII